MATGPETDGSHSSETQRINPEDLRNEASLQVILDDYRTGLDKKSSYEVDALMNRAVSQGLFEHQQGEHARPDDAFDGAEVVAVVPDVPELGKMLHEMKLQKQSALMAEKTQQLSHELESVPENEWPARMAAMLEASLRNGEVTLSAGQRGRAGKPGQPAQPDMPSRIVATDRRQAAVKDAFEYAASEWLTDPAERQKYAKMRDDLARRAPEIQREEAKKLDAFQQRQRQEARAQEARERIEAQARAEAEDKRRSGREAAEEQTRDLGLNRVVLPRGTRLENGRALRKATEVVDQHIHAEALAENEQREQERRLGSGAVAIERAHAEALAEAPERERLAREEAIRQQINSLSTEDRINHEVQEHILATRTPEQLQQIRDASHEEALREDGEALVQARFYEYYQERINQLQNAIENTPDRTLQAALRDQIRQIEQQRDEAIAEAVRYEREDTQEVAEIVGNALGHSQGHEAYRGTMDRLDPNLVDKAMMTRELLALEPVPFLELKKGGLFARFKNRGPKVIESYFRAPGNEHLVVVERRRRRNGELLSQTVLTTEQPIRHRGEAQLPPREVEPVMDDVRQLDKAIMMEQTGSRLGSSNVGDYVHLGFDTGNAFIGGRPESEGGIYADYGATQDEINRFRGRQVRKRGGFWYWLTRGRV